MTDQFEEAIERGAKGVEGLWETHPHIDLQGLDHDHCRIVATAVLKAVFPFRHVETLPDESERTHG